MELMDIDNGYFMVKFDHEKDCEKFLSGGPWMLFYHYLVVREWSSRFFS